MYTCTRSLLLKLSHRKGSSSFHFFIDTVRSTSSFPLTHLEVRPQRAGELSVESENRWWHWCSFVHSVFSPFSSTTSKREREKKSTEPQSQASFTLLVCCFPTALLIGIGVRSYCSQDEESIFITMMESNVRNGEQWDASIAAAISRLKDRT